MGGGSRRRNPPLIEEEEKMRELGVQNLNIWPIRPSCRCMEAAWPSVGHVQPQCRRIKDAASSSNPVGRMQVLGCPEPA